MKKSRSIRTKFTFILLGVISLAVTAVFTYHILTQIFVDGRKLAAARDYEQHMIVTMEVPQARNLLTANDIDKLNVFVQKIKKSTPGEFAIIYSSVRDSNGKILAHSFDGPMPDVLRDIGIMKTGDMNMGDAKMHDMNMGDTKMHDMKMGDTNMHDMNMGDMETGNTNMHDMNMDDNRQVKEISVEPYGQILNISQQIGTYGSLTVGFKGYDPMIMVKKEGLSFLIIYFVCISLGVLISLVVSARMVAPLKPIMEGIKEVGSGRLVDIRVESSDELGEIATVFNETASKLRGYIQTDSERKKTQENVINFLEVVSTAAEGDFTTRAPVTTDVIGSIADAFNMMTEELSLLIAEVRSTAEGFEKNSLITLELLKNMSDGSETQMVQLRNATEAVDETAQATLEISEKSQGATELSIKAVDASQKGEQLVNQSIEGMQLIRASVQIINKKMKMFSEKVLEIGTISGMIGDISSRTNLLSMNASIEAARAGEAGRGFVVIAEEIRSLADRSADATRDITAIIRSIQTEAGEITSSLEEETEIVEKHSLLAVETKSSFNEITKAVDESKEIVSEILPLSQTQRKMTGNVVLSMEHSNRISLDLLRLVQDSESISENLSGSSKELIASVAKFKLIETSGIKTEKPETAKLKTTDMEIEDPGTDEEVTA